MEYIYIDIFFYIQKLHVHTGTLQTGAKRMVPGASEQAQKERLDDQLFFSELKFDYTMLVDEKLAGGFK